MNSEPSEFGSNGRQLPVPQRFFTRPVQQYGVAVIVICLACLVRGGFADVLGSRLTYITFFPAVMLAALLSGFGPGVLATVLAALYTAIWILEPVGQFAISDTVDAIGLAVFVCLGVFMSFVAGLYHEAIAKVAAYEQDKVPLSSGQPGTVVPDASHLLESPPLALRKRLAFDAACALILTILISVGWLAWRDMTAAIEADRWTLHTHVVIEELDGLLSCLKGTESGQRGFIITGDETYLKPYQTGLGEIGKHLNTLRRLTADNPHQQKRLATIAPLVATRLAALKEIITLRKTKGFQAASEAIMTNRGRDIMDELRALVDHAREEEKQLLQIRSTARETDTLKTIRSLLLGGTLGGLAILLMFVSLKLELARRRRVENELLLHRDHLQDMVAARTQELERTHRTLQVEFNKNTRAMAELRDSEERIQGIVGSAMDAIISVDASQHIVLFNASAEKMFRCSASEAIGTLIDRFIPGRFQATHADHIRRFAGTGVTSRAMGRFGVISGLRADGEEFPIEASISQIEVSGQKLFTVILRDISERKQAEERLRLQAAALQTAANAIAITDRNGCIQWVNEAFTQLTGYSAAEAMGQNPRVLKSGRHDALFYQKMWETVLAGRSWHGELVNKRKDGSLYTEEMTITPVTNINGTITHFVAIKQDVTERHRIEEALHNSEARLTFALETIHTGAWELDLLDHTAYRTPTHDRVFGYATLLPQWTYEMALEHVLPEDRGYFDKCFREATAAQSDWNFECRIRRADGEVRWISAAGRHVRNAEGKPVRMAGVVQDITDRKRAEEEIRILNRELEERVRSRTLALQTSNQELEAFCYSVSHDLRAPLRSIDGFSHILMDDYANKLDAKGHDFLQRVREGCQRMSQLIDDLLNLSRLSRSEMHPRPVNLSEVAQEVAHELQEIAPGRAVQFQIAEGVESVGDPALLRAALWNLLANAWKFTGNNAEAVIEFGVRQKDGQAVYFVRDNGAGFDMAYVGKLFQPFQRLHGMKEFPGTGIGLATVGRIIRRHGGRVWAEAIPGQGATFYFTLNQEGE
jgi:hypothetical protein